MSDVLKARERSSSSKQLAMPAHPHRAHPESVLQTRHTDDRRHDLEAEEAQAYRAGHSSE